MNTSSLQRKLLGLALLIATLAPLNSPPLLGAHDHDHIYVTMVEYLGFQRDNEHFVIKVKRNVDDGPVYYYLHFTADISSLRSHEGERMQISLGPDGEWARLTFRRHGTWRIHSRERVD